LRTRSRRELEAIASARTGVSRGPQSARMCENPLMSRVFQVGRPSRSCIVVVAPRSSPEADRLTTSHRQKQTSEIWSPSQLRPDPEHVLQEKDHHGNASRRRRQEVHRGYPDQYTPELNHVARPEGQPQKLRYPGQGSRTVSLPALTYILQFIISSLLDLLDDTRSRAAAEG